MYIDYDPAHPQRMFEQIDTHMKWITSHPKEALAMAQRAQVICKEKFTLEKQLTQIIQNHSTRQRVAADAFYARKKDEKVLAVLFLDTPQYDDKAAGVLANALANLEKQIYKNITLAVCCETRILPQVQKATQRYPWVELFPMPFYDALGNKELSRAQAFFKMHTQVPHQYVLFVSGVADIFSTHVTQLKRALEENEAPVAAYSASSVKTAPWTRKIRQLYQPFSTKAFYSGLCVPSDLFLMRAAIEHLPLCTQAYIDNCLPQALLTYSLFKGHKTFKFVPKISCEVNAGQNDPLFDGVSPTFNQLNFIKGLVQPEVSGYHAEKNIPDMAIDWGWKQLLVWGRRMLRVPVWMYKICSLGAITKRSRRKVDGHIIYWEALSDEFEFKLKNRLYNP